MTLLSHHDFLLEILSIFRKYLIHNIVLVEKYAQETNWKQKFQKPQNENICLTNLNVESLCKPRVEPNDGAARAEANLFAFCQVVTEFEELKLFELYRGTTKFR